MATTSRDIHGPAQSRALIDLLQSLFVAELLSPSPRLWLFFAWISDVDIIDNSSRAFSALEPDWPAAPVRLSQVLEALLTRGSEIRLVLREQASNDYLVSRLLTLKHRFGRRIKWATAPDFHAKGMIGRDFFLSGSMNLTNNGITVNGEHVVLRTDPNLISEQAIELEERWGGLVR
ncbi:phospholipase D-like domain-containing protein DpdK [Thalassobaculum sp.]|uniref:phospholipase D-like domain-containing protein DpdK n=1 Tax=Thalassobaculum sp. TaxID=2022740 RepID=UPI003B59F6F3